MKPLLLSTLAVSVLLAPGLAPLARAQSSVAPASAAGIPVHMIVTTEFGQGSEPTAIPPDDVAAWQGRTRLPITEWVPLQGDKTGAELYVFIDERLDPAQPALFEKLRRFVMEQPPSTAVGIAYMFNGEARIAQTPTSDHALAAKALRASTGTESAAASPYTSLSWLVGAWPKTSMRREVLLVTDGIDRFGDFGELNMYVDQAVADAQRGGVQVYCLYAPSLGHSGHSPALIRWGQTYLSQVAEETGGETYIAGDLEPFLADITTQMEHQYRVTFLAQPGSGPGLEPIRFTTEIPNVDLIAAYRFAIPGPEISE